MTFWQQYKSTLKRRLKSEALWMITSILAIGAGFVAADLILQATGAVTLLSVLP